MSNNTQPRRKDDEALRLMRSLAEPEESTEEYPVMHGAIQAIYELLRDALVALVKPRDAPDAHKACLTVWLHRSSSLLGAGRVQDLLTAKSGLTDDLKTNADEESMGMAEARGPPPTHA